MSRPVCACCLRPPLSNDPEQPYAIEVPFGAEGGRDRFNLCSACIIFVSEEVSRKMRAGGGIEVVRGAIQRVKESYERGRAKALKP
jgi:hypothetical protein